MNLVFRVLRSAYAQNPFDGEGSYRHGGRWSSPGTRLCYTSEHQSLAMLEYFVHLDANDPPDDLVLAIAEVPDELSRENIKASALPDDWRQTPALPALAALGDEFVQRAEAAVLLVPSALAPRENNWLLNPLHPDFRRVVMQETQPLHYDTRMFMKAEPSRKKSR